MDEWKVITFASLAILAYEVYYDMTKTKKPEKPSSKSFKICLTGGPCGGKTEGVSWVYGLFQQKNIPAFIVPEAATILGSGGALLNFPEYSEKQMINFQYSLMKMQIGLEDTMTNISNIRCATTPIILCDRGLMDGKAYLKAEQWQEMLTTYRLNEDDLLKRYQVIVHMVTTADGIPTQFMKTKIRTETIDEAVWIDSQLKLAWQKHPNRLIIDNEFVDNFDQKKAVLMAYIYKEIIPLVHRNIKLARKPSDTVSSSIGNYLRRKSKLKEKLVEKSERKMSG